MIRDQCILSIHSVQIGGPGVEGLMKLPTPGIFGLVLQLLPRCATLCVAARGLRIRCECITMLFFFQKVAEFCHFCMLPNLVIKFVEVITLVKLCEQCCNMLPKYYMILDDITNSWQMLIKVWQYVKTSDQNL